jgi:hypothetical protein
LTEGEIAAVIEIAARAPSVHNTQPWKFRVAAGQLELLADTDRMLRAVDPDGRELMMSCGAALAGLRLGLRKLGLVPAVTVLPDPLQPWLVAQVWPDGYASATAAELELITAVPHRHTHRGPFVPGVVPPRLLGAMHDDAATEGCTLTLIETGGQLSTLSELTLAAAGEQQASAEIGAELRQWIRPTGSLARDGIPARARVGEFGSPWPASAGTAATWLPPRDFGRPGVEEQDRMPPGVTAVLTTAGNAPADWVRAGQALNRMLLRAATRWIFARLQSQPLESAYYAHEVRTRLGLDGYPQMVLQLGRSNVSSATPRRPQAELMANQMQG